MRTGFALTFLCVAFQGAILSAGGPPVLWYEQPAEKWEEALPIGNGRLGGMVFGRTTEERIQLNEDTFWSGRPHDYTNVGAREHLDEVRELIFKGKYGEAQKIADERMMGVPRFMQAYQTLGDLRLKFPGHEQAAAYRRQLNLRDAIVKVTYRVGDATFTREVFSSAVDQAIVIRLSCDKPGRINVEATMDSPHKHETTPGADSQLAMAGQWIGDGRTGGLIAGVNGPGMKFETRLRATVDGGKVAVERNTLRITEADGATLVLVAATSYKNYKDISADPAQKCAEYLLRSADEAYEKVRSDHVADFRRFFDRVELSLGDETSGLSRLPTDRRIVEAADAKADPPLAALYYQFGRYLMISCSRPGTQAANLQGIWNQHMRPTWGSKYTTNINLQMNYWPAEQGNLAECHEPLFDLIEDLTETGGRVAKEHYGCGGWVLHHNTDIWRGAAPVDWPFFGLWPSGGGWLCQHLWEHYEFGGDKAFLARAYPIMKGAARFYLDYLVEDPRNKWLVTCPSNSPENAHHSLTETESVSICAAPTMDVQIVHDLFGNCIKAAQILDVDEDFQKRLAETLDRLPPMQIGKHGQLQEWLTDIDEPEIQHRHLSHLFGLHPGNQIAPLKTPKLAKACKVTLTRRGDAATGWSLAWKINHWARLYDGDHAHLLLKNLLRPEHTLPSMLDNCPPFVIDGNFGGCSGISEMLLQSHTGEISLLPALPGAWSSGSLRGFRARGGFEVDIEWESGQPQRAIIRSKLGGKCRIRSSLPLVAVVGEKTIPVERPEPNVIVFETNRNATVELQPAKSQ